MQQSGGFLDHDEKLPIGSKVQAVFSEDGEWYGRPQTQISFLPVLPFFSLLYPCLSVFLIS